ncbi:MAG TPA: multidrug efflux SMR transporter [Chloroflexota bacterium]|nr:multidrug efflux SMR transporter [Chloroflexota bacterium]
MVWVLLVAAGILETVMAVALKASDGFSRLIPSVLFLVFGSASFGLLSLALRSLPVGTAYAIWTGVGAVGTALVGIVYLGEPATALRLACIALIVAGVVGLRFAGGH